MRTLLNQINFSVASVGLALAATFAAGPTATASVQVSATFFERQIGNASADSSTDLFQLAVSGTGPAVTITSVSFALPNTFAPNDPFFDLLDNGVGVNPGSPYLKDASTGVAIDPVALVVEGGDTLSLTFLPAAGFGDPGDTFDFTTDVDDNNAIVRAFDINDQFPSLRGTDVLVTLLDGRQFGFQLDTPTGDEVAFTTNTGQQANWFNGITGSATIPAVPEPTMAVIWVSLASLGLIFAGGRRA